jgi:hypothetical protein
MGSPASNLGNDRGWLNDTAPESEIDHTRHFQMLRGAKDYRPKIGLALAGQRDL